jgi:hypothetical protein
MKTSIKKRLLTITLVPTLLSIITIVWCYLGVFYYFLIQDDTSQVLFNVLQWDLKYFGIMLACGLFAFFCLITIVAGIFFVVAGLFFVIKWLIDLILRGVYGD